MPHQSKAQILLAIAITALVVFILSEQAHSKSLSAEQINNMCKLQGYHDCALVVAIARTESSFNANEINGEKTVSYGLLQVQCGTAKMMGLKHDCTQLFDPKLNIRFAIKYLRFIEKRLKTKSTRKVVAAWNAGMRYLGKGEYDNLRCKNYNVFKWHGSPPVECFPGEFINEEYVWKVTRRTRHFRRLLNEDSLASL